MQPPLPTSESPSHVGNPRLVEALRVLIAQEGPIGVDRFMALALGHPTLGYYTTRDPFGAAGDFTTAPEISQMFGEMWGLWAAAVWESLGRPAPVRLVELGPGRGTLMADALRAAAAMPAFRAALDVHLVETSPVLRAIQRRTLGTQAASWHASMDDVPAGFAIVFANEFFDALPIRQFVRTSRGWCERLVGLDPEGCLTFGLAAEPEPALTVTAPEGTVIEINPAARRIMGDLGTRLHAQGGAMLIADYGSSKAVVGDTLQAVQAHRFVDVLTTPGEADLTAHVDFAALERVVAGDLAVHLTTQGDFLRNLGISLRAESLARTATVNQREAIATALERLTGPSPGMGELFKVMAVTSATAPVPPGFVVEPA